MNRYRFNVTARAKSTEIAEKFAKWIIDEHGPDLLTVPGCQEYRMYRLSETCYRCEYLFGQEADFQNYLSTYAESMRAKGRAHFSPGDIEFERDGYDLVAEGTEPSGTNNKNSR